MPKYGPGGGTGHAALTLAGTPDYITLSGQQITRTQIDLTADVTGVLPVANSAAIVGPTIFVAASDALAGVIAATPAAYRCDGTDDEEQIKAAHDALPAAGGTIVLSDGTFTLGHALNLSTPAGMIVIIRGQGMLATTIDCPAELQNPAETETTHCALTAYFWGMVDRNAGAGLTMQGELVIEDIGFTGHQTDSATRQYVADFYDLNVVTFRRCYIHWFAGNLTTRTNTGLYSREIRVEGCRMEDFGGVEGGGCQCSFIVDNHCARISALSTGATQQLAVIARNYIDTGDDTPAGVASASSNRICATGSGSAGLKIIAWNHITDPYGSPIGWDNQSDRCHVWIVGNSVRRTAGSALQIGLNAVIDTLNVDSSVVIADNYLEWSEGGVGSGFIAVNGISNVTIRDNTLHDCGYNYLCLVGPMGTGDHPNYVDIYGNRFTGSGAAASGPAILLHCNNYKVHDNIIAADNFQDDVIEEESGAGPGEIYNNDVSQATAKGITVTHAATRVWNNKGHGEGTANTGVIAAEYTDGRARTTVLTVSQVDALTTADAAAIADGYLLYTFPAGALVIDYAYMSLSVHATTEQHADTPDVGLGTVIASGAVATLDGTATFENIITGQTAANASGTATVKTALPTGNIPFIIAASDAHTLHFNVADTWANDTSADLTADIAGTVVVVWHFLA